MSDEDGPVPERHLESSPEPAPEPLSESDPEFELGWRAREIERELPGLGLMVTRARLARPGALGARSPVGVEGRLRELANRFRGPRAVTLRREPVPAAYRAFFRQLGLDPDVARTPIEAVALERMLRGGFLSGGLLEDSLLIALVDTGVPVWALDTAAVDGPLGIRTSVEGEPLGRSPRAAEGPLPGGRLVVADASAALAVLFGGVASGHEAKAGTIEVMLFAIQVAGVPALYVEEALWICRSALEQR